MQYPRVLRPWLLAITTAVTLSAQAVVSTHSGVVNFSDGPVFLDDQPLNQSFGTFANIKEGSVFRTGEGRAEVLLTPGIFLRLDQESAIRMVSNALDNTRVEFLRGAVILDSNAAPAAAKPVVITYKNFQLRFLKPGVYRVDAEPGVFETYTGEAEVREDGQSPKMIDESHQFFFNIGMETKKYGEGAVDTFSEWARNRAETVSADNQAATQSLADPAAGAGAGGVFADPGSNSGGLFTAPVPSFGLPGYGGYGGLAGVDPGLFFSPYGPYNNPYFGTPFPLVIYVFPRLHGGSPGRPRTPGYPVLPPSRTGLPHPLPGYPPRYAPTPIRTGLASPSVGHVAVRAPTYGHVSVGAPRMNVPAAPHPIAIGPAHR